jgi:hypothetical protein
VKNVVLDHDHGIVITSIGSRLPASNVGTTTYRLDKLGQVTVGLQASVCLLVR